MKAFYVNDLKYDQIRCYFMSAVPKKYLEVEEEEKCKHDFSSCVLWKPGDKLYFHTEIDYINREALIKKGYINSDAVVLKIIRRCIDCDAFEMEELNEIFSV